MSVERQVDGRGSLSDGRVGEIVKASNTLRRLRAFYFN